MRLAIHETIKTMTVELGMPDMKAGKKEVNNVISTIGREDFSKKASLKQWHI